MEELATQLKKEYESKTYQRLLTARCNCGRFTKIIMSNYISENDLYAILYCKRCKKFLLHCGGSTLNENGEVGYVGCERNIEYASSEWYRIVEQIEKGKMFL